MAAYITKSLQMSEYSNNPVYNMTDVLQLVLINVLYRSILAVKFHKVV